MRDSSSCVSHVTEKYSNSEETEAEPVIYMARIKTTRRRKTTGIQPTRRDTRVVGHTTLLRPGSAVNRLRSLLEQAEGELLYREDIQLCLSELAIIESTYHINQIYRRTQRRLLLEDTQEANIETTAVMPTPSDSDRDHTETQDQPQFGQNPANTLET